MADNLYQLGDVVPLKATFTDAAGNPTDTTVALAIRAPNGTVTNPTPTHAGLGVYSYNLTVDQVGLWWYTFTGSGTVSAVEQNSLVVEQTQTVASSLSPQALVTLEETREYVLGRITDDSNDDKLIRRINAFSAAVTGYTAREWLPVTANATRTFGYRGYGMVPLAPHDLRTASSITVYTDYPTSYQVTLTPGDATTLGQYRLRPVGGDPDTATYRWVEFGTNPYSSAFLWFSTAAYGAFEGYYDFRGQFSVSVTGDWGIGTVPDDVKLATLIAIDNSYLNPVGAASRTLGPLQMTEAPETDVTPDVIWRALPAESRALLTRYRETTVLIA